MKKEREFFIRTLQLINSDTNSKSLEKIDSSKILNKNKLQSNKKAKNSDSKSYCLNKG